MTDPTRTEPIIGLKDVTLSLRSRAGMIEILRGVDLAIRQGQSISIAGPSGSGKSSLLMIMTGLERATSGQVQIAGHDFSKLGESALARVRAQNIGIVFQSFHLVPTMSAIENVALPLEFLNYGGAIDRAQAALDSVGLAARAGHYPSQLSGGEQQRVALARAIVSRPRILFADEPTGNLDENTGNQIVDLMFALHRRQGTTLVLITHDQRLAQRCERKLTMRNGRAYEGAAAEQETAYA